MRGTLLRGLVAAVALLAVGAGAAGESATYPTIEVLERAGSSPSKTPSDSGAAGEVVLRVATGRGDNADGELGEGREWRLERGVRSTVYSDTFNVRYIDQMQLNDRAELEPVIKREEFGSWLDVTITDIADGEITAIIHYVRKQPVNVAADASDPRVSLPEADLNIVSREVVVPRGGSRRLQVRDDSGALHVQFTASGG